MNRRLSLAAAVFIAIASATPAVAQEPEQQASAEDRAPPDFAGRYDGSSFETAMGIQLNEDGTWQWGLSVGALDMRAEGTWEISEDEQGYRVDFTSAPTPVFPEFRFLSLERLPDGPLVQVILPDGEPFQYADAILECEDAETVVSQIYAEGWRPEPGECDEPVALTVIQPSYNVQSERYVLEELDWEPGMTVFFEFKPNDLGVMDLTGMIGRLQDGILTVEGPLGLEEFRKIVPREPEREPIE